MSATDNARLVRSIYEAFNARQFDRALDAAGEDVEITLVPFGLTFRGRQGFRDFMQGFASAFEDISVNLTNQVAGDDQVVCEFIARGKHTGPLMTPAGEIPPTGRSIDYPVVEVYQFSGGKVARMRNYFDAATLMRQLGLLPEPNLPEQ